MKRTSAQQDLRFIVGEFQMMQSFLKVANKGRASNEVVKTWVRQLRDLAFDVEDCVEFVVHLENKNSAWTWVWRLVPSCMAPPRTRELDEAVAELKQLKARVEEVSQRNTRYNLIRDSDSSLTAPAVQVDIAGPSAVDLLLKSWEDNHKRVAMENLPYLISNGGSDCKVISIWRSAGAEPATTQIITDACYCVQEVCQKFKTSARVKLMHPFSPGEFIKSLLNQLYVRPQKENLGADLYTKDVYPTQDELRQLLSNQSYLIVLEDLSSAVEWDFIKSYLPDVGNGSRIIITTEQFGVAVLCTGEPYLVSELGPRVPDGQYAHAIFNEAGIPTSVLQLSRQLGQRRVICLRGDTNLAKDVQDFLRYRNHSEYNGVRFKKILWEDVPRPIPIDYIGDMYFVNLGMRIQSMRPDSACLVVINSLQSTEEWDDMKCFCSTGNENSCTVIITNNDDLAKYCEDGYPWLRDKEDARCITLSDRMKEAFKVPFQVSQNGMLEASFCNIVKDGVTAVWGTIGVGKSAIVRCSYYAEMAKSLGMHDRPERFRDNKNLYYPVISYANNGTLFRWVDVPDPFDLAEFSRRLFLDLHSSSRDPQQMETEAARIIQGHDPVQGCYDTLRDGNYRVVIDGLRSTHDWDSIRPAIFPYLSKWSCIVVITTEESVAKHCVHPYGKSRMLNIRALEDNVAIDLFCEIASGNPREYAKDIVPKCGGLPKIIAAVAQAPLGFTEYKNDGLVFKLQTDPHFHHLSGVLSWMHSYFDNCPDSVKPSIFYLSVFPTNCNFRKGRLLRRWIAEGYCRDTTDRTAKENAENLFAKLIDLGIVQQPENNCLCQINGFFREYIISQPMEDNLVFALEGYCKLNSQRTGQHLTIMKSWDRDENVFNSIDVSRLRSLTVYGTWEKFFISKKMKRIRVLDLEGMSDLADDQLECIFGNLRSLKFINLRGCRKITCLPITLGGLRQLETLDVRGTRIVKLPQAIIKLQKIQYIQAGVIVSSADDWTAPSEDDGDAVPASQLSEEPANENCGGVAPSQPSEESAPENCGDAAPSPPQAPISPEDGHGTRPMLPTVGWKSKLSCSILRGAKFPLPRSPFVTRGFCVPERRSQLVRTHNGGVEVPEGIENMPALHTLGVVIINSEHGKYFLTKLKEKKLSRLVKLRVSGINKENWPDFCSALSDHSHLESLSVRHDNACLNLKDSAKPPKTLKSLKLHGPLEVVPVWIKEELVNLKKLDIKITVSMEEFMPLIMDRMPRGNRLRRLSIKPVPEVEKLDFSFQGESIFAPVPQGLKIDCSSKLEVMFGSGIWAYVEVLIIHCYKGSSFRVSWEGGLEYLDNLKTVWLKGLYSKADWEDLKGHVNGHKNKPSLKPEKPPSS